MTTLYHFLSLFGNMISQMYSLPYDQSIKIYDRTRLSNAGYSATWLSTFRASSNLRWPLKLDIKQEDVGTDHLETVLHAPLGASNDLGIDALKNCTIDMAEI